MPPQSCDGTSANSLRSAITSMPRGTCAADGYLGKSVRFALVVLFGMMIALAMQTPARAQAKSPGGADYVTLKTPQSTEAPGKIEVIEFFWYGCPHCYSLEPALAPWVKALPADVQFRRVPGIFDASWAVSARVYYAFEALGLTEKLHKPLFDAIHRDKLNIVIAKDRTPVLNEPLLREWLKKQGVDAEKFMGMYNSFGVDANVKRASQLTRAYGLEGVPAIAVQGRHVVPAGNRILGIADTLIAEERKKIAPTAKKK